MRIGLNLLYLLPGVVGGTETYAAGLLDGLASINDGHVYFIFLNVESAQWPIPSAPNFERVVCPIAAANRSHRYLYEQIHLPRLLRQKRVDVVHSLGYVSPLVTPCPSVVTIHDLNYKAFGDQLPLLKRLSLTLFVRLSAVRAQYVITDSKFSQLEIMRTFDMPLDRVVIIQAASRRYIKVLSADMVLLRLGIQKPYCLAFHNGSPNKNIPRLLDAFTLARTQYGVPNQLVLVGRGPTLTTPRLPAGVVVFTGYLTDSELQIVLSEAQALIIPSTYEGFGLPILEAQQAGVPVICSNVGSMPEVAGSAAVFFDPYSVVEIAFQMAQVILDPRRQEELQKQGYLNIRRFSWERAAKETVKVYERIHSKGY